MPNSCLQLDTLRFERLDHYKVCRLLPLADQAAQNGAGHVAPANECDV